jgi:hypothetical protein
LLASRQQYLFDIYLLLHVQSLIPDDGRKDCPKHAECYPPPQKKINKMGKLMRLVEIPIEIYCNARSYERQASFLCLPSVINSCTSYKLELYYKMEHQQHFHSIFY